MRLPHPSKVDPADLAEELRAMADKMIQVDGDRDHMNPSNLTCGDVEIAFRLMLMAANKLTGPVPYRSIPSSSELSHGY